MAIVPALVARVGRRGRDDDQLQIAEDEDELTAEAPRVARRRGRPPRRSTSRIRTRGRDPSARRRGVHTTASPTRRRPPVDRGRGPRSSRARPALPSDAASSASRCRRNRCRADRAAIARSSIASGFASAVWANCHVLVLDTLVRMADSKWELPVLYSISVPGVLTSGRLQAYATQFTAPHPAPVLRAARGLQPGSHAHQILDRDRRACACPDRGAARERTCTTGSSILLISPRSSAMPTSVEMTLLDTDFTLASRDRGVRARP